MNTLNFIAIVLIIIVLVILIPFVQIWAINTLFGLGIEYTASTWLASFCLGAFMIPRFGWGKKER